MNNLYKSIKPLPDTTKEVITFLGNGKRKLETKKVTERYLLTNVNGNSIAITKDQLKDLGISVESIAKEPVVEQRPQEIVTNVQTTQTQATDTNK